MRFAIAIDPSGKCRWDSNSITGDHVIEILTEKVSTSYLAHLREKKVSYIFAGRSEHSPTARAGEGCALATVRDQLSLV